ncbi:MAG: pyruvate dehydrogenase (acetyl-transferring), homodimeric type [Acidimicrobiia bacterium]|nr:pyruvate dehydrogenase (acetyl-transferring), homodimeric type [Acidimicrobiia bacterium]
MLDDGYILQIPDGNPEETEEWLESLDLVVNSDSRRRARYLLTRLTRRARELGVAVPPPMTTPYINTIPPEAEPWFPGDEQMERRIRRAIRWNAAVMVVKANEKASGIGGHLSSFASSAAFYDVGFNHFFKGNDSGRPGDHVYFQGHASPGIYARAFLEGRLTEEHLDKFRSEVGGGGLSSYPHPRLMPDFWQYPTVSMGLGPINSIYHARFLKYLHNRGIEDTEGSRVWGFLGDGETDEPETVASIDLAAQEGLDNLTWVINCNLQRLDGPVRGNGKIIQELEALFRGAGWNVIKVIWGETWDPLLAKDHDGVLVDKMNQAVDGEYQRYKAEDGAFVREHFFGPDPRLRELVADMSDDEVWALRRGGHDYKKLYAAYKLATELEGAPTVILAKTIKGWTLGPDVEGRNATHQIKKLTNKQLMELRSRLSLEDDIPAESLEGDSTPPYLRFAEDSPEYQYLMQRRRELNGPLPSRTLPVRRPVDLPPAEAYAETYAGSGTVEASTTMAFVRLMRNLSRIDGFGERVVPIVPDEARTFGMDSLFREMKIYASHGQKYEPVDAKLLLSYAEGTDGQILEEGITEAGALASWIAAATSYAHTGVPMIPFFIFYSMFGFQRVMDLIWAAADSRARGFLIGATAGRTTLMGEGLQHQDGHSLLLASAVPVCRSYDPAFAYEMGVVIEDGIQRMYGDGEDVFYYLTAYNENYVQPPKPEGVDQGIIEGMYRFADAPEGDGPKATILFSGTAHTAAREAQGVLVERYGVRAELWSVTSYQLLREEALEAERWNRFHPTEAPKTPIVTQRLALTEGPIVAVSDFMHAVADQVSRWVPRSFLSLGTDGFGRSDTREALRSFFETDTPNVVVATLAALAEEGTVSSEVVEQAINDFGIDRDAPAPWRADV